VNDIKPHLSHSQMMTFLRCPEAWRRRYVEGHKVPPGIVAFIGSGVHAADSMNFVQKIESHVDLKPSEFRDAAVAELDARIEDEGVSLQEEDGSLESVVGKARDQTAALAFLHATQVAPDYQPAHVEREFRIDLPKNSFDLVGFIDLEDDKGRVVDFKTTGRRKQQAEADRSLQLSVYAAAHAVQTGKLPGSLVLDVTMRTDNPSRYTLETHRDKADLQVLANTVAVVSRGIESGVFPPAPEGSWWCSKKFCGYWSTCAFVNAKKLKP